MKLHHESLEHTPDQESRVNMSDLASFTFNCPSCGKPVTTTAPRELLDKTEHDCPTCTLEKDGTMAKIKKQMEQEKHQ